MTTPEEGEAEPQQLQRVEGNSRRDDAKSNNGRPTPSLSPSPSPPQECPAIAAEEEASREREEPPGERRQAEDARCEKEPTLERSTRGGSGASPAPAGHSPVLRCQGKGKGKGKGKGRPKKALTTAGMIKAAGDATGTAAVGASEIEGTSTAALKPILKKGKGKRPRTGASHKRGRQEEEEEVRRERVE